MLEAIPKSRWSILIFLVVWLSSCLYLGLNLNKGWNPYDEGTLGQSAERILHGELPHRDFDEPYTGGLSYINAAIFKLFGVNLFWLRLFLFVFFVAWVPAIYALARQFLAPLPAAGVTLVAVAWSVPNYPAAMPSWFNLFFASFATLALARYIRKPAIHWLLLAGLCGGCSFLIKSAGLYFIAAALLFFTYREQSLTRNPSAAPRRTPVYSGFLALYISLFVLGLIKLVFAAGGVPRYLHFVFPGLAIAFLLAFRERPAPSVSSWPRFKTLFGMAVPFILAAAFPVIFFGIFYWRRNALPALLDGLFVTPLRKLFFMQREPAGLVMEYPAIIAGLLILETSKLRGQPRRVLSIFLIVLAALVLLTSRSQDLSYLVALQSAWAIIPVLSVAAVIVLLHQRQPAEFSSESAQFLFLLFAVTFLISLIQFPYAQIIYFCYCAPLAAILAASLLSRLQYPPRALLFTALAFYVLFAAFVIRPRYIGSRPNSDYASTPLNLPRVGLIRVSSFHAQEYEELIPFVTKLAGQNSIFAAPDCPQIYFLSGLQNPTPFLFDYFRDPHDYELDLKSLFDRSDSIKVVVVDDTPDYGAPQLNVLRSLVPSRFPNSRKFGSFTVYWRS